MSCVPPLADMHRIYLDYNSTTPCAEEVVEAMIPFFGVQCGNPASPHVAGREALAAITSAREDTAAVIGGDPAYLFFTSGATEANNLALMGMSDHCKTRNQIVVSAIEHKSVLGPASILADKGFSVSYIPVDRQGCVDADAARTLVNDETLIVSVQGANNETGVIQPVAELAAIAHLHGAVFHCDMAQMLGKERIDVNALGADILSLSAHKAYGPKGVGAFYIANRTLLSRIKPILSGGGQERGLRAGTHNVPGIVGFGCACRLVIRNRVGDASRICSLRERIEQQFRLRLPGASINGLGTARLPGTTSLTIPGIQADMLIANLPNVCIGDGAACSSGAPDPSHVLLAMGLSRDAAECTVRLSLGRYTALQDVDVAVDEIVSTAMSLYERLAICPRKEF